MRYSALRKSLNSLSVLYLINLWRAALLLSCPLHGGATTLKRKRQEISVENLIASLDVEENARAKDTATTRKTTNSGAPKKQLCGAWGHAPQNPRQKNKIV